MVPRLQINHACSWNKSSSTIKRCRCFYHYPHSKRDNWSTYIILVNESSHYVWCNRRGCYFSTRSAKRAEHLGRSSFFRPNKGAQQEDERIIQAFDKAIQYMSKRKIGALITIERNTGLDEYIETGIDLDADITGELLINIFIPNTPLHDGAVIIKNEKIAVASAYLPLSESNLIPKEFGTRHRAAVGISEVSDAITIVVSEETGDVSLTLNNELIPD